MIAIENSQLHMMRCDPFDFVLARESDGHWDGEGFAPLNGVVWGMFLRKTHHLVKFVTIKWVKDSNKKFK